MAEWYYIDNGQQAGPVNDAGLRQLAKSGQLSPEDLIWKDGLKDWVPAKKAKGLFDSIPQSATKTADIPAAKPKPVQKPAPQPVAEREPETAETGEPLAEDTLFHSIPAPGQEQDDQLAAGAPQQDDVAPLEEDAFTGADQSSGVSNLAEEALAGADQSSGVSNLAEGSLGQDQPAEEPFAGADRSSGISNLADQPAEEFTPLDEQPQEQPNAITHGESGLGVPTPDFEATTGEQEQLAAEEAPATAEFDPFADSGSADQSAASGELSEADLMSGVEETPAAEEPPAGKKPIKPKKLASTAQAKKPAAASASKFVATAAPEYVDDYVPPAKPSAALAVAGFLLGLFALVPGALLLLADSKMDPRGTMSGADVVVVESSTSDVSAMYAMAIKDVTGSSDIAGAIMDWRVMLGVGGAALAVLLGLLAMMIGKLRKIVGLIALLLAIGGLSGQYLIQNELVAKVQADIDQATCAANLALIGQAAENYRQANGQYPADIETMMANVSYTRNNPRKCPAAASIKTFDYFYIPPAGSPTASVIVASDLPGNHADKTCVLYSNGVVKWLSKKDFAAELETPANTAYAAAMKAGKKASEKSGDLPAPATKPAADSPAKNMNAPPAAVMGAAGDVAAESAPAKAEPSPASAPAASAPAK